MRIGILEDDATLTHELRELLGGRHQCYLHASGESLLGFLTRETVDLLVLDWDVHGTPASDIIRCLRDHDPIQPPIVVLITRTAEHDIIAALKCGADGYAIKPLQPAVLLARIEALYERWHPSAARSRFERYGDFEFDTNARTVFARGIPIPLTSKELALSLLLFRNQNRTLSRTYIFEALWGGTPELQTRTLDSHISKVRTKLDLRGGNGLRLIPVYGFGYRLEAVEHKEAVEQDG